MVEAEKETKENPYVLSIDERTCPNGLSTKEKKAWLNGRIELQREGIEHGVRPQNLFGLPPSLRKLWLSRVWNPYLLTLSMEERQIIKSTVEPGREHHRW